jgi:hypothetical protein
LTSTHQTTARFNEPHRLSTRWAISLSVATVLFLLALDGASFSLVSRHSVAIALAWSLGLAALLGLLPRSRVPWEAWAVLGLLAAFAVWTGLSMLWASDDAAAFHESARAGLYLAATALPVLVVERRGARAWIDGLALGLVAVGLLALASRLFPSVFPEDDLRAAIGLDRVRLSYPVDYWNGLGILVALSVPLLVSAAARTASLAGAAMAVAPLPALAAVIYLT